MSDQQPKPDFPTRARAKVREILADAATEPPLFVPVDLREIGTNAVAKLLIHWRSHPKLPNPDECEQAILELLYRRGTTINSEIMEELTDRFSTSTVNRRLHKLVMLKVIRLNRDTPRGYDLIPWLRTQADITANSA